MSRLAKKLAAFVQRSVGGRSHEWPTSAASLQDWQSNVFIVCWLLSILALASCIVAAWATVSEETGIVMIPLLVVILSVFCFSASRMYWGFVATGSVSGGLGMVSPEPFFHLFFANFVLHFVYETELIWLFVGAAAYCLSWLLLLIALNPWTGAPHQATDSTLERQWTGVVWFMGLIGVLGLATPAYSYFIARQDAFALGSADWSSLQVLIWIPLMAGGTYLRKQLWPHMLVTKFFSAARQPIRAGKIVTVEEIEERNDH